MQQTSKYQFNLVETGDAFSPTPLNENIKKVETVLSSVATELGTGGQNCRIAHGSYVGKDDGAVTLTFDFYPLVVFVTVPTGDGYWNTAVLTRSCGRLDTIGGYLDGVSWADNGITYGTSSSDTFNYANRTAYYVAIGV